MAIDKSKFSQKVKDKYSFTNETFSREVKSHPKDRIEVEVGDSKQSDFKPQFKVMRWDNEVNFSMRAEEHPSATVETEGEKIKYITPDYEVHQYDRPEVSEDGGFEFEWVLPKKPKTNVLTATIQTKGLDFFYQPALTPEEVAEGAERPENIVGSYAVYHSTKGGLNDAAGMEYKVGKAFHIYRPEAVDAQGNKTWCELSVDVEGGLLAVTVPQNFLDVSKYPIIIDPTLGYSSIGGSTGFEIADNAYADWTVIRGQEYTLAESGQSLVSLHIALDSETSTENLDLFAALYSKDSAGSGSHYLHTGIEKLSVTVSTTPGWVEFLAGYKTLVEDTYIISTTGDWEDLSATGYISIRYDTGSSISSHSKSTSGAGAYNTRKSENPLVSTPSTVTSVYSVYATYAPIPITKIAWITA